VNYFIKRDLNEYGPYTLADLQKYVASGNILLTDLCRSEGLTDWVPVSQVIGNIPVPAAPQPAAAAPTAYAAPGTYAAPAASPYPPPPNLHWALVLLLTVVTCGLFAPIWLLVEALWIRKVKPEAKSFTYLVITMGIFAAIIGLIIMQVGEAGATGHRDASLGGIAALLNLGYIVMRLVTVFSMRSDIEDHFNTAEPIGLSLSGVMTFFFAVYYFQYHFSQINEMKRRQAGYPV
jgi:hypothetical protein